MIKKFVNSNKKSLYIMIIGIVLICMTLGTAILTSTLTIKGKSTIKKSSWVIYFDNIEIAEDSAKNDDPKEDAKIATEDGNPDLKRENIQFTANLKKPGDFYEFTVYTVNDGTIDAEIESIEKSLLSEEQQKYIEFEVKYDDGADIKKCDVLQAGTRRLIKTVVRFKDGLDISEYPSEPVTLNLYFKINYSQNVNCPVCEGEECVVKRMLTIRPNGGLYDGRTVTHREYLQEGETYTLKTPTRNFYNFTGWRIIDPETGGTYTFDENTFVFTMGNENVIIEAEWEEGDYVARIMNKYYRTIQEAFNDAKKADWEDNTVWLLKDTTEYPVNNTPDAFVFNLDGHTVTGKITNSKNGNLTLVEGKIIGKKQDDNDNGEAVLNYGNLTLGKNDDNVEVENSITLVGDTYGLYNVSGSKFNFYDGYIEATHAMSGITLEMKNGDITVADNHYVFIDQRSDNENSYERVYLTSNPNRAVVKTTTIIDTYYYNLQDAIRDVADIKSKKTTTDNDYIIYAIRDFEAAYPIEVSNDWRIFFDLDGYDVKTGETITNEGYFKIYDSKSKRSQISAAKTITNKGVLEIDNVDILATADINVIDNTGNLKLTKTHITTTNKYCVKNTGRGKLDFNEDVELKTDDEYALYNSADNVTIKAGKIYGLYNEGNITLEGENTEYIIYKKKTQSSSIIQYIHAIYNTGNGTITMNNGNITSNFNTNMIINDGTFNYYGGTVHSEYTTISNSGKVNVYDNEITSTRTSINGGTINVHGGKVTSDIGPTISSATTNVKGGSVVSENGYAINVGTTYVYSGEVYSETENSINNSNVTVQGGTVRSEKTAVSGGTLTIKGGTVTGKIYAANVTSFTASGGEVIGTENGVITNNLTMSGGEVTSTEGTGIIVSNKGLITGGTVKGALYGVHSKNELTLGIEEEPIDKTTPVLIGETYGLYIAGSTTNFYDGILKGQADGYGGGEITGTPLGGVVLDGEEMINEVHYNTDHVDKFKNWLRIGDTFYNTLNAASQEAKEGDIIVVIKDTDVTFKQSFTNENKNLKVYFDLNGHKVTTTQTITNLIDVTIIDSSEYFKEETDDTEELEEPLISEPNSDVGAGPGTLEFKKNTGIINSNKLNLNGGRYEGVAEYLIENRQQMTVDKADIETTKSAIYNNYNSYNSYTAILTINNINIISSYNGVYTENNTFGNITMNGGIIKSSNNGLGDGYITMNGGEIISENNGIYGIKGEVILNNQSKITANKGYAVYRGESHITINNGEYISKNNIAIEGHYNITMNDGKVTGTTGIKNGMWCTYTTCFSGPITINDGEITGTVNDGIYVNVNTLYFFGGISKGNRYGIYNKSHTQLGKDDKEIDTKKPVAIGEEYGLYTVDSSTYFFDGILKGKQREKIDGEEEQENVGHIGLIELIPDATMIKQDYEFIDTVEYDTEYLETLGNWLKVGDVEFNSINAAQAVIDKEGTIEVIKDAYVNFEQTLPKNKNITFDLNGHSVILTQPIVSEGDNIFTDSQGNGLLNAVRDVAISNSGTSVIKSGTYEAQVGSAVSNTGTITIEGGTLKSLTTYALYNRGIINFEDGTLVTDKEYAVYNTGKFNMNNGEIKAYGGIFNPGTIYVNGGHIEGVNVYSIYNTNDDSSIIVNDGEVYNEQYISIYVGLSGSLTVNGGKIESKGAQAVSLSSYLYGAASVKVVDGEIIGKTYGITTDSSCRVTITGGHILGETKNGVTAKGPTNITGGVIEGGEYGVYSASDTTTLGINNKDISIDSPLLKGGLYGLYIGDADVDFFDGILKGKTYSYNLEPKGIRNIPERAEIVYEEEEIDGELYHIAYLFAESDIVKNLQTGVIYDNLQDSIDEAEDNQTLQLLTNVPIYYEVVNNNENHITIDMNGKTISTNKKIINNGLLKITNDSPDISVIKTSASIELITNTGNLEISNVTLANNSSSNYTISNKKNLKLTDMKIDSINGVDNTSELVIENSEFKSKTRAIYNTGKITINGGTYEGTSYSIYSNTTNDVNITGATLIGIYYGTGNNNTKVTRCTINGDFQNNRSTTNVLESKINGSISNSNSGNLTIDGSEMSVGTGGISNSSTIRVNNSKYIGKTPSYYFNSNYQSITNTGTMDITESNFLIDASTTAICFGNTGTLNIDNSEIVVGNEKLIASIIRGIRTYGSGNTTLTESKINILGGSTGYGIYSDSTNAKTTILTGTITLKKAPTTYGVYINQGTFTMGNYEGTGDESAAVSKEDPKIESFGTSKGIGVKNINGTFNFFDGVIWASRYAKPETTNYVELNYEATTYVDKATGYEYSWLEYMKDDYVHSDAVAKIDDTFYPTVQAAIEKALPGQVIILLKSTQEDLVVDEDKMIIIDLNSHSITTKLENNGTLNVYNGSLQSFEETTVVNNGTFIMGQNDGEVSSTNVRVVSENLAIENNGKFIMYDGYLEGNPSIQGEIDEIAEFSRIYTTSDSQSERKFLQSLDEESIRDKKTALILTIDPNTGYYENDKKIRTEFLFYEEEYTLSDPIKNGCIFLGWELSDGTMLDNSTIKIGLSDITVKAKWKVSEDSVAKIGDEYYTKLADAISHAKTGDTIELFKDVKEDITVDKEITLDLGGKKVTGYFINLGILRLINGTIENPEGVGILNRKTLTLGENEGDVNSDYVKVIGKTIGIQQEGRLNFYDGTIEGEITIAGPVASVPQGFYLYTESNTENNRKKVYLIGNPENAVAIIKDGETQYFFSLQDAIDTATLTGKEIFIAKSFEANYPVSVNEGVEILINLSSYNMKTGNTITNNGTLRIYDSSETKGSITSTRTITNNGNLTLEDITINQTIDNYAISNSGHLNLIGTTINGTSTAAINTTGTFEMDSNSKVICESSRAIYNNQKEPLVLNAGYVTGISNNGKLVLGGDIHITSPTASSNTSTIYMNTSGASTVMNGGTVESNYRGVQLNTTDLSFEMSGGSITADNIAIYTNGKTNKIIINDGDVKSKGSYGIYDEYNSSSANPTSIEINGGTVVGANYGVYLRYDNFIITAGEIATTSVNRDDYALYCSSSDCIVDGGVIGAEYASGIYSGSTITINGGLIYSNRDNGYGVYTSGDLNMSGGTIKTIGTSSYGICADYVYATLTMTINDGKIESENIGVYLSGNNKNYYKTLNVYGGSISGKTYGMYQAYSTMTTNIGSNNKELSTTIPYITGGLYGIYKTEGVMNFYNGRLRGSTFGYNNSFNDLRVEQDIVTEYEKENISKITTYTTTSTSSNAVTNTAKTGDGHARITYIGEPQDLCEDEKVFDYYYRENTEQEFKAPCEGKYKLEVWGAQGGYAYSTSRNGGYGGYSYGEIMLESDEVLYINVGGQGKSSSSSKDISIPGGYNGGGTGIIKYSNNSYVGSGGGATHIATSSGILSSLESNPNEVIIVAGGGGGAAYYNSSNYGSGGSGGGYIGANGTSQTGIAYGTGGTQSSGGYYLINSSLGVGSFGQGANTETIDGINYNGGAGGGGWYGGGASATPNSNGGGGGSGYIGNSRLLNAYMYGYNVPTPASEWVINYLAEKEAFLEVNNVLYNSIDKAVAAIEETGTIKVIKSVEVNDAATIPKGKNITLDLNGYILTTTQTITNKGTLTVTDSTGSKDSMLKNIKTHTIYNHGDLIIDSVAIKSSNSTALYGNEGTGTITLNENSLIEGYAGLYISSAQTININNSTIIGTDSCVNLRSNNIKLNIKKGEFTSSNYGFYLYDTSSNIIDIDDLNLTATGDAMRIYGKSHTITIDNSNFTSDEKNAFYYTASNSSNRSNLTITGGKFIGANHGIYDSDLDLTLNNVEVETKSTDRDNYAIYCSGSNNSCTINKGSKLIAKNASGLYSNAVTTINEGEIIAGADNGYAIYNYSDSLEINGGLIKSTGNSSYGIYSDSYYYTFTITINDGNIESENVGIYLTGNNTNYYKTLNVYGGSISGKTYGIHQAYSTITTNIGEKDKKMTKDDPYITGGLYGIYINAGVANFYSGTLRGKNFGYYGDFNDLRTKMQIHTLYEVIDENGSTTRSTNKSSETALSEYSKKGNGYVRITYLDENTDGCEMENPKEFDYTGSEVEFKVPCDGTYKLEVWGAQGGSYNSNYYGGYGGYSSGNIELNKDEILYINVGGKGTLSNGPIAQGGYNGGGKAYTTSSSYYAGSGGGATHIATSTGLLKELEDEKDSIIIVAGGGGGAYYYYNYYSAGGSAGGYIGGIAPTGYCNSTLLIGQASTVDVPGTNNGCGLADSYEASFGEGGAYSSSYYAGGGGGYYGGGFGYRYGANGGSGYINEDKLTSSVMYGYNIEPTDYVVNYLVDKEGFLRVGDKIYNSLDDAVEAIAENGTIYVINDSTVSDSSTIPSNKTITLDLQGHTLTTTQTIINKGTLTVTDSVNSKNSAINNVKTHTIYNRGTLTIDNVAIKSSNSTALYGDEGTGTITLNEKAYISGYNGLYISSAQTININGATIYGSNICLNLRSNDIKLNIKKGEFTSSNYGIYLYDTSSNKIDIDDLNITATGDAMYIYGKSHTITIDNSNFTSDEKNAFYYTASNSSNRSTLTITGGKFIGAKYGIYDSDLDLTLNNVEVETRSTDRDNYAIYCSGSNNSCTINKGSKLIAKNASGLYSNAVTTINEGEIIAGADNGYAIYNYSDSLEINGGLIKSTGNSSYGIYSDSNYYTFTITINDGNIESENVGIYLTGNNANYYKTLNVYGGSIKGNTYGIQHGYSTITTNIGSSTVNVSKEEPVIVGGTYSIYKPEGNLNFNSGLLRGYTKAYFGAFNNIRDGYEVFEDIDEFSEHEQSMRTYGIEEVSEEPISQQAKKGNGHARITYIGDTVGTCQTGSVVNFEYTGTEKEFTAKCAGLYRLEVWGAQGGSYSDTIRGGYGAYSVGNIELKLNERLYINVGGQGNMTLAATSSVEGGYNGGGTAKSYNGSTHVPSGSGGGATHIATSSGLLKSLENDKESVIIVAGGGGGSAYETSVNNGLGGSGGGYRAANGTSERNSSYGTGATQSAGGYWTYNKVLGKGTFGQGADTATTNNSTYYGGAGGGGWYGGGASGTSYTNGGGGGSGYIGNSRLTSKAMYGYNIDNMLEGEVTNIAYLIPEQNFITNETTGKEYSNLQLAFNEASDKDVLKMTANGNISYDITVDDFENITLDLNGYNLLTSKNITNNSKLKITNSDDTKKSKLYANVNTTLIINNSDLTISNLSISSSVRAITNTGTLDINESTITGTTYALYDNSKTNSKITNSTLSSSNTALYKYSTGKTTITDTDITGTINNNNSSAVLDITGGNITGLIVNTGNTTIKSATIKHSSNSSNEEQSIENNGQMTLTGNNIKFTNSYPGYNSTYQSRLVYNKGTLISSYNHYTLNYSYNNNYSKSLIAIRNDNILTSSNDSFDITRGRTAYAIALNGSNENKIENATINIDDISVDAYGIYSGTETMKATVDGAKITISNVATSYGVYVSTGTLTMKNGTYNISGTEANGIYIENGVATLESGTINTTGTTSYGVRMINGTLTLGIYDGRGNESSDVSVEDPHILAVGDTGIGISMGRGTFNFYDGYFSGSTFARPVDDMPTNTEPAYKISDHVDEATNYKYCVLEYTR